MRITRNGIIRRKICRKENKVSYHFKSSYELMDDILLKVIIDRIEDEIKDRIAQRRGWSAYSSTNRSLNAYIDGLGKTIKIIKEEIESHRR